MDGFKADFVQYLRENNLLQRADLDKNDANINVQKYDDQLTDFLRDYRVDENELVEVAIDVNEILSMDFDDIANVVVEDNNATQGRDVVGGFFNFLINQNDIKAQVDKDGNGKFSDDEIAEFARTIASKDGDDSGFTLQDMLGSYQQMQNNEFRVGDFTAIDNNMFVNNPNAAPAAQGQQQAPAAQGQQQAPAGQGKQPPKTPQTPTEVRPESVQTITSASLNGKTKTELNNERDAQQSAVETNQKNAEAALQGEGAEPSNQAVLDSYTAYENLVNQVSNEENRFAQRLAEKNGQIENKRNEMHTWQMQAEEDNEKCMQLDVEVKDAKTTYETALDAVTDAQGALDNLQKPGEGATDQQIANYNTQLEALQKAVTDAKTAADEAKEALEAKEKEYEDAVDVYNNSLAEVARCHNEFNVLLAELTALQKEIAAASAENAADLENAANQWNEDMINNENSRQDNFEAYARGARAAASNVAVIDIAIENLPPETITV